MTAAQIVALLLAVALIGVGILSYRHGDTQGGVILMFVGLLCAVYGLGLLDYRPSPAELEQL